MMIKILLTNLVLLTLLSCSTKQDYQLKVVVPETTYYIVSDIEKIPNGNWGYYKDNTIWVISREFSDGILPDREILAEEVLHQLKEHNNRIINPHLLKEKGEK